MVEAIGSLMQNERVKQYAFRRTEARYPTLPFTTIPRGPLQANAKLARKRNTSCVLDLQCEMINVE